MKNHQSSAISLTQDLVRIESTDPGTYEKEIGEFIYNRLSALPVSIIRKEVLKDRYNIMAKIKGEIEDPALVYICHMDTVTIGDGWTTNPLGAEVKKGRIYGRGACDMKAGLACALSAFAAISGETAGRKPKHSFVFIGTVDEEDFMRGVEDVIKEKWVTAKSFVVDTEPTNGTIQVAHKGRTWFEITVTGATAHASTPWEGADAIAAMAEIISYIRCKIKECPSHKDLGFSTVTFGQIEGGYRPYVVPDHCKVWIDMRLVPPTDTDAAVKIVTEAIHNASARIPGITGSYKLTGNRPYIEKDETSSLLKALKTTAEETTGGPVSITFFPGYTDSAVIAGKLHNPNCMSYGPGDLKQAHKPNEFVPCEDIVRCEEVLTKLARFLLF